MEPWKATVAAADPASHGTVQTLPQDQHRDFVRTWGVGTVNLKPLKGREYPIT